MDIDTDQPAPTPIEECLENIKQISYMIHVIQNDILFIKSKIKEAEQKNQSIEIEKSWYWF
tara:strand:- start:1446 stop:1628 length:183 start_codon:yes stop_codon:yes gene_type:complete